MCGLPAMFVGFAVVRKLETHQSNVSGNLKDLSNDFSEQILGSIGQSHQIRYSTSVHNTKEHNE